MGMIMGLSIRIFMVEDDDTVKRLPLARYERLLRRDPDKRLSRYASKRVRYALIVVDLVNRQPIEVVRDEYAYLDFDGEGRFKEPALEKEESSAFDMLDFSSLELNGEAGEINRDLLRQYKTMLLSGETTKKFMGKEFYIVGDYLEFLSEIGKNGLSKIDENIADYLNEYKENDDLSKSGEKYFRRAINRFFRLRKEN
jgi:hypothetical protein